MSVNPFAVFMKRIFYTVSALMLAQYVQAQQDSTRTNQLDEVVVTATKSSLKQSQTGKIITVIDREMIRNSAGRTLSELLNTQTSVFINGANNTPGTNQDIYFRGASTGNVLVAIDGIPVYDPSQTNNSFDLNSIPLEQIERVEILKGGQSTLWGSDAVAGVLNIILKKQQAKPVSVNANAAYGSYNTWRAGAGLNGSVDKLSYNLQYNYTKSKGISSAYDSTGKAGFDKDGFEQNNVLASLHYAFSKAFSAKAFGNFSTYRYDMDAGAFTDDKDYTGRNRNNLGGLLLKYQQNKITWQLQGSYQQAKRTFVDDSTYVSALGKYSRGKYTGNTFTLETFGNIELAKHLDLVSGVQYMKQQTDQSYLSISDYGPYATSLGKDSAHINQESVYASLLLKDVGGFNMEAGGRFNHHSIYGNNGTFTVNPSYVIDNNTKVFVNISSAYKIPTLYQLYSEYGNKDLRPESSVTYEIGVQTQSSDKRIYIRLAAFKRDLKNLIIFVTDPNTYISRYVNRDKQNDYGFELENTIQLGRFGTWSNNLTYVDGQGKQDNVKVDNLYRRPKFTLNSTLSLYPVRHLTIVPAFRYVGARLKGPYDIGPAEQPHYYTVDCFIGYDIAKKLRLFANFQNITNQQYFDIVGYTSKRFNMMAGVNLSL